MNDDDVLFECDFSIDELAVLADLLEIPALPGVDPDMEVPDEAKGAAARGLLARGVVVVDGTKGSVEITQPYATMIATVLLSERVNALATAIVFAGDEATVWVARKAEMMMNWSLRSAEAAPAQAIATAARSASIAEVV